MERKTIEQFFLNTLLRITIAGVTLILLSDVFFYPEDTQSIIIDTAVLVAAIVSFILRDRYENFAALILTLIVLAAMFYQCIKVPMSTTNSLSIILLVGFVHAVMFRGRMLWVMQCLTISVVFAIFLVQFSHPEMRYTNHVSEMITIVVTYSIVFYILTYAAAVLKASYDRINAKLRDINIELTQKAHEIEAQNEELMQMQDNLSALNTDLERMVEERTAKIRYQHDILLKYSYSNAHHLRGPVARLLGLANVFHANNSLEPSFIIGKMVEQAHEIDAVVRQINVDLEAAHAISQ